MSTRVSRVLLTFLGCACLGAAAFSPLASAEPVLAELRVEGPTGTLDPGTWYVTDSEQIRKSQPGDACLRDQGRLEFPGPSALGIVQTGSESTRALRQVRVRLDEAGPFVCEIGGVKGRPFGDPSGFSGWTFFEDFVSGSSSADLATIADGDRVLWAFSDFGDAQTNTGDALELIDVPAGDEDGSFEVGVLAHRFDGTASPADGATIAGAAEATPLGAGRYAVTVPEGETTLTATRGSDIPSNQLTACVQPEPSECPVAHGRTIFGSPSGDRIKGTRGSDRIASRGGDDRVDVRSAGTDRVLCGGGQDTVLQRRNDPDNTVLTNCERLRRR